MPETNHAIAVDHGITPELTDVPLMGSPARSPEQRASVEPKRARIQQGNRSAQAPSTIGPALRVNPNLERRHPGLQQAGRFRRRGEGYDDDPCQPELCPPLSQLRQVLLARESAQIAEEDQDGRLAAQILKAASLAAKVGGAERWRRLADRDGHCSDHDIESATAGLQRKEPGIWTGEGPAGSQA